MPGLLLLLAACGGEDESGFGHHIATSDGARCPDGMIEVQGGGHSLGETDGDRVAQYGDNIIPVDDFAIVSFCIATYPFPGESGQPWPVDGLSYDQVAQVQDVLADAGRRLCTVTELVYAAAGKSNWRYPTDPDQRVEGDCDPDDGFSQPLGSYPDCLSSFGVADLQVRSAWGRLDDDMADLVGDQRAAGLPVDHDFAAWGGTSRDDTYYAPDNFGVHFHESGDEAYTDDGLRVCADRSALGEEPDDGAAYRALLGDYQQAGSFSAWLDVNRDGRR